MKKSLIAFSLLAIFASAVANHGGGDDKDKKKSCSKDKKSCCSSKSTKSCDKKDEAKAEEKK